MTAVDRALLRPWLLEDFGLDVGALDPVTSGADAQAAVWRVTVGASTYAVKLGAAGTETGHMVAAFLAGHGVEGIAEPTRSVKGGLWTVRARRSLTVAPWIDGDRAAEVGLTNTQWRRYGVLLRSVHDAEPPPRLRRALPRHSRIDAQVPQLAAAVRSRIATPRDDVEAELAAIWTQHAETVERLLVAAPPPDQPQVICHGDPHLGNVVVGDRLYLIDWDDAIVAAREQDLMFMLGGMGDLGPSTREQCAAFLDGYGAHNVDGSALRYYRQVRAREDVVLWTYQALDGPDRRDCLRILQSVLGPEGLAALAVG